MCLKLQLVGILNTCSIYSQVANFCVALRASLLMEIPFSISAIRFQFSGSLVVWTSSMDTPVSSCIEVIVILLEPSMSGNEINRLAKASNAEDLPNWPLQKSNLTLSMKWMESLNWVFLYFWLTWAEKGNWEKNACCTRRSPTFFSQGSSSSLDCTPSWGKLFLHGLMWKKVFTITW